MMIFLIIAIAAVTVSTMIRKPSIAIVQQGNNAVLKQPRVPRTHQPSHRNQLLLSRRILLVVLCVLAMMIFLIIAIAAVTVSTMIRKPSIAIVQQGNNAVLKQPRVPRTHQPSHLNQLLLPHQVMKMIIFFKALTDPSDPPTGTSIRPEDHEDSSDQNPTRVSNSSYNQSTWLNSQHDHHISALLSKLKTATTLN